MEKLVLKFSIDALSFVCTFAGLKHWKLLKPPECDIRKKPASPAIKEILGIDVAMRVGLAWPSGRRSGK